jgi:hypothetical protein
VKPSPEFRQHHDVDEPRVDERAFRPGWRVHSRFDQLLADRKISRGEWQAGSEYRSARALARSMPGPGAPGMVRIVSSDHHDAALDRVAAVARVHLVELAIGSFATALVVACVVEDLSWASIGRQCQRHPETIREWTASAIRLLAAAWARAGALESHRAALSERPGPPRPVRAP